MAKVVYVDKTECTSCYACAENLPEYFRMDDDDLAESHNDGANINAAVVQDGQEGPVQEEMDQCPGECIHWK